jgi:hypothetical protein
MNYVVWNSYLIRNKNQQSYKKVFVLIIIIAFPNLIVWIYYSYLISLLKRVLIKGLLLVFYYYLLLENIIHNKII